MSFFVDNNELLDILSNNIVFTTGNLVLKDNIFTSNITLEITSNTETRIGMYPDSTGFRGFMCNTTGVYFKSNVLGDFTKVLGPGELGITTQYPIEIAGTNLSFLYNSNQFALDGANNLIINTAGVTNANLANSNIIIDNNTLALGGQYTKLALDLQNASNLAFTGLTGNITSGQITNGSITGNKLTTATITNNLLANSAINFFGTNVDLGSGIYQIPAANITGTLVIANIPTDFANIGLSQVNILSGNANLSVLTVQSANIISSATISNIIVSNNATITTATITTANITNKLYLSDPTKYLELSNGDYRLVNANLHVNSNLLVDGDAVVTGNLRVFGVTTTINSNVVTINDPVITLGGNTAPSIDDNLDRGIAFHWYTTGTPKLGFMGFRDSDHTFRFIPDATDTNQVYTGANGSAGFDNLDIDSNIRLYNPAANILFDGNTGIRINTGNIEIKNNTGDTWKKLYTATDITTGNALSKSDLTLNVLYDNNTIGINGNSELYVKSASITNGLLANSNIIIGASTLVLGSQYVGLDISNSTGYQTANLVGTITNAQLTNANIQIDGNTLVLGSQYSNIALNLGNSTGYQTANLVGTITNGQLTNANIQIDGNTLVLGSQYSNIALNLGNSTGYQTDNLVGTITNGQLSNNGIIISGVTYTLGSDTANIEIHDSNCLVIRDSVISSNGVGNLAVVAGNSVTLGKHVINSNTFTLMPYGNAVLTNISGTANISLDFGESSSFMLTLASGVDLTLANPGNITRLGQQGSIYIETPSTGSSHILRWYRNSNDSAWYFPGGSSGFAPSISASQSVYDVFNYIVVSVDPNPKVLVTDATGFSRYS